MRVNKHMLIVVYVDVEYNQQKQRYSKTGILPIMK